MSEWSGSDATDRLREMLEAQNRRMAQMTGAMVVLAVAQTGLAIVVAVETL